MDSGWIKLHRKFVDWEWYDDNNTKILFLHCLLKANHRDKKWRGMVIKRGTFVTSLANLGQEVGLSVQSVRTSIKRLESTGEITRKSTHHGTTVTVTKYATYQLIETDTNTQDNTQGNNTSTSSQHTPNTRLTTTKNDKKNKKEYYVTSEQDLFDQFRNEYRTLNQYRKVGVRGLETEWKAFTKKHSDWKQILPLLLNAVTNLKKECAAEFAKKGNAYPPNLATFLNQRQWEAYQDDNTKPAANGQTDEHRRFLARMKPVVIK